jgi:PAS domain-containing protein
MAQKPLEIILARQFADSLNMAIFIVDPEGNLIFYNEPAEEILGIRFGETGSMPVDKWAAMFTPTDENGKPLPPEALPLVETLSTQKPAYGSIYIDSKKDERYVITISSLPICGRPNRYLGAMAIFWRNETK